HVSDRRDTGSRQRVRSVNALGSQRRLQPLGRVTRRELLAPVGQAEPQVIDLLIDLRLWLWCLLSLRRSRHVGLLLFAHRYPFFRAARCTARSTSRRYAFPCCFSTS